MDKLSLDEIDQRLHLRCCFTENQYAAYFLSPSQFAPFADRVGAVRASTYRQVSPLGPTELDLDGRDAHYWHLLIFDRERQCLAGALRMSLSCWHGSDWDGSRSYLEHCYPGLDAAMKQRGVRYAEIGRTFVAPSYQRTSPVLRMLLRAMASIPMAAGHDHLLGMVSYNHMQHSEELHQRFLHELLQPPFRVDYALPQPRHPFPLPIGMQSQAFPMAEALSLNQLERVLKERYQEPFRAPLLLKKYMGFGNARVVGLSIARDFNQICEILMLCKLNELNPRQVNEWIVADLTPVWEQSVQSCFDGANLV